MADETENSKRYFHALNAGATISGGGFNFKFECYTLCGTWMGVYSTNDPDLLKALDGIISNPRSAVTEIDQAEFDLCLKKKPSTTTGLISYPNPQEPTQTLQVVLPAGAASTVDGEIPFPPDIKPAPVLDVESILRVGIVKTS